MTIYRLTTQAPTVPYILRNGMLLICTLNTCRYQEPTEPYVPEKKKKKKHGRGKREAEGRGTREAGRGKREAGRGKREAGRGKREAGKNWPRGGQ